MNAEDEVSAACISYRLEDVGLLYLVYPELVRT